MFRTDALENVLVFLSVKAAQGILTEDIDSKVLAYLVPELQRHPGVVVCGEGTSVLWAEGKADAAIRLEQLWDELGKTLGVDILCGYALNSFHGEKDEDVFQSICAEHSAVCSQ